MTGKKLSKKESIRRKEEDRETRLLRSQIHTQLDNAIYAFMYAVETHRLKLNVEKAVEDRLITFLFDPDTVKMVEKEIRSGVKTLDDLISGTRHLASCIIEKKKTDDTKLVLQEDLEAALLILLEQNIWPFNQLLNQLSVHSS